MNTENKNIETIQKTELEILKKCLEIITSSGLHYYMLGGTLLGAVRHNGFIPWDDDIDIGLPRHDYECFLKIAKEKLSFPYTLETYTPGSNCNQQYFAKVTDSRIQIRLLNSDYKSIVPVWVDIFPLDGVPETPIKFWIWKNRGLVLAKLFTVSQTRFMFDRKMSIKNSKSNAELGIRIIQKFYLDKLLNRDRLWHKLDKHLKRYEYASSSRLINFCGHWHLKEMFPKSYYGEGKCYSFEDVELIGPDDYNAVLTQMYGSYMELPPEEKRQAHDLELV